jgi:type IV pilus assembly protein PilQ
MGVVDGETVNAHFRRQYMLCRQNNKRNIIKYGGALWLAGLLLLLATLQISAQEDGSQPYSPPQTGSSPRETMMYQRTAGSAAEARQLKQVWSTDFLKGFMVSGTFNRTDIRNVLRVFYEQTGLNFIINEEVRGTVTGRFTDVPALEALITVLRVNNLYFIEEGSIIRIVPPREYRQDIITKNMVTRMYDINHAQFKTLQEALAPVLTEGVGKVVLDPKTNKLMITDLNENFEQIEAILDELSRPGKQVYIDVKVVSIDLKDGNEHGINWGVYNVGNYFSFSTMFNMTDVGRVGQIEMQRATHSSGISGDGLIRMLNTYSDAKVLTSPKIVAAHGEKAKIHIGDEIPYISRVTKDQNNPLSTESEVSFVDAGIKVDMTPEIGSDNTIRITFEVEISSANSVKITDTQTAPQKTVTRAESIILCDNDALVVIGGLFEHRKEITEQRIPLLGQIPILKYLFSWKQTVTQKREIAILIHPRIIDSSSSTLRKDVEKVVGTEEDK